MPRIVKGRGVKSGLPPGTMVHIGELPAEQTMLHLVDYTAETLNELKLTSYEECLPFRDQQSVTWLDLSGVHDLELLQRVGDCFGLHPLVLEDIANTNQRPKLELYDGYAFIVMKMLALGPEEKLAAEQVAFILGPNYVLSFREGVCGDLFEGVRERLRKGRGRLRSEQADYLAYSLMDTIVDNYFVVFERLGELLELLEDEIVARPTNHTVRRIHGLKRDMIYVRRAVWPLREVLAALQRGDSPLIRHSTMLYLRDVYDHTIQAMDSVDTFRDMLSSMLDVYLTSLSNRMNEVMKFLTIIGTIFIPLTFIAGVYGMNFHFMPELSWKWGYAWALCLMLTVAGTMLAYFRRKRWL